MIFKREYRCSLKSSRVSTKARFRERFSSAFSYKSSLEPDAVSPAPPFAALLPRPLAKLKKKVTLVKSIRVSAGTTPPRHPDVHDSSSRNVFLASD